MDTHVCEVCGQPATLHVTEVGSSRVATERHRCDAHAAAALRPAEAKIACSGRGPILPRLRDLIRRTDEIIGDHGRRLPGGAQ